MLQGWLWASAQYTSPLWFVAQVIALVTLRGVALLLALVPLLGMIWVCYDAQLHAESSNLAFLGPEPATFPAFLWLILCLGFGKPRISPTRVRNATAVGLVLTVSLGAYVGFRSFQHARAKRRQLAQAEIIIRKLGARVLPGRVDPESARTPIVANIEALRTCYQQGLGREPTLSGSLVVRLEVDPSGRVASVEVPSTLAAPAVEGCIASALRKVKFASSMESAPMHVTLPLTFDSP